MTVRLRLRAAGLARATRTACLLLGLLIFVGGAALAQGQRSTYAIRGATIHTLAGEAIERGTVVIQDGRIAGVGRNLPIPSGAKVINARGLHVYPGMIDAFSHLGLTEIRAVGVTSDLGEKGDFNPHLKAVTAVHPASEHIPVTRANGITHAVIVPANRPRAPFPGQASMIHLDGWTWEQMQIEPGVAMVLYWPRIQPERGPDGKEPSFKEAKKKYDERVAEIERWIEAAKHYGQSQGSGKEPSPDSKLEALVPLIQGKQPVLIVADRARQIRAAVAFAGKHDLKMILGSGRESHKVADLLKEKDVPVILGRTEELPAREDDPYDDRYTLPSKLHEAGVRFAFGTFDSANSRTLPYQAAAAVAFGLPYEEGLKSVTLRAAEILGLGDRLGTIEEGKIANLIVTNGDPLEIRTETKFLFINGRLTSTDNKHLRLYEKYRARPSSGE